jgi:5-amino-6-(5-phospho-D-ribitylamino)uracil phosphatase
VVAKLKPLRVLEGAVDDPQLANPLARMHRLGTGWFGVILEFEGVLVDSYHEAHRRAWVEMCEREKRAVPPRWMLDRAEGMKNEQVGRQACRCIALAGLLCQ